MSRRILVVDDEPNIRLSFRYGLLSDEWEVEEASSGADAIAKAQAMSYDLMLLDLRMPGIDGIQVLQRLNERNIRIPAILVSAHATTDTVIQAIERGTLDFLTKPVTPDQLRSAIREVLERFDFVRAREAGQADSRPLSDGEKLKLAKYDIFQRRYQDAEKLLRTLGAGDEAEEAFLLLGILSEIRGDFQGAEAHYSQVVQSGPNERKDGSRTGWLFEQLGGGE